MQEEFDMFGNRRSLIFLLVILLCGLENILYIVSPGNKQ